MKQAKKNRFLTRYRHHFHLFLDNRSHAETHPVHAEIARWVWQACKNNYRHVHISVLLCDEAEARRFNHDYRGKDYATNVLSFALNEGENMLLPSAGDNGLYGDMVLCPQVIAREAEAQHKALIAHYAHLTVHSTLHLMGYDHIDDADAAIMEALEIRILHQLGYDNPYAQDEY